MKRCVLLCLALIGAGAVLLAADFWEKKEFTEWSDKDVARMMEDSPWSREVNILMAGRPSFSRAGGESGGGGGFEGGGGGGGRGGRGGGGLGDSELARPALSLHVRWMSALPVKQALVRSSMSSEQQMDERTQQFLKRAETHYLVAVSDIPARMVNASEGTERFVQAARIERGNHGEPLAPERVEARPERNRMTLYFFFPRTNPITLEDKNVEFVLNAEQLEIKRKFKLQEMVYQGKLEL